MQLQWCVHSCCCTATADAAARNTDERDKE